MGETDRRKHPIIGRAAAWRWWWAVSLAAFVTVVGASTVRVVNHINVPGEINVQRWALKDYRDTVYYPVTSFLNGDNPYDTETYLERYPVDYPFAPYTPLFLIVHGPAGLMSHATSQIVYFWVTIALTVGLAWLTLVLCGRGPTTASVFGIATLVLASKPGHWNLMLGQTSVEFTCATYIALLCAVRSHRVSGLAVAASTMKPTFGLPLAVLLLAQRFHRPVVFGLVIALTATLVPTAVLVHSAGGVQPFLYSYLQCLVGVEEFTSASPVLSSTRVDAVALVSRLLGRPAGIGLQAGLFLVIMTLACAAVHRVRRRTRGLEADLFCASLGIVAMLVAVYNLTYSAVLLVLPLAALVLGRWVSGDAATYRPTRWILIVLLSVPMVNYAIAARVLRLVGSPGSPAWLVAVSINGASLLVAFLAYVTVAFRISET